MKVHSELCTAVDAKVAQSRTASRPAFSRESAEDRLLLVKFLLHCADLSNPLAGPAVSRRLANLVSAEFNNQAERERSMGLPVTALEAYNEARLPVSPAGQRLRQACASQRALSVPGRRSAPGGRQLGRLRRRWRDDTRLARR